MNQSNYLAELWGITIASVSLVILLKPKLLERLFTKAKNKSTMFFWGVITLVIGIAMVFIHNLWIPNWRVIITIIGWLTLIKGMDLLLLPNRMKNRWSKMGDMQWRTIFILLFLFGLVLSYLGFSSTK